MNKGQVATWLIGLLATIALAFNGIATNTNNAQQDSITDHEGRISSNEANVTRIPYLEGKIDKALELLGSDPRLIEREVKKQLDQRLASSTTSKI